MNSTTQTQRITLSRSNRRPRLWLQPLCLLVGFIVLWLLFALILDGRHLVPFPWELAQQINEDFSLLLSNTGPTLRAAAFGFIFGALAILPLAALSVVVPSWEPIVVRVAVVVHVIPFVAIAPIIVVTLPGEPARIMISALQVYFPLLIGLLLGLKSTDERAVDVVQASGGGRLALFRFVRIPSALPNIIAALQIAVPAAILGALIAEFFGSDRGLGAILINTQDSLIVNRVWAIAMWIGLIAAGGYGVITLIARFFFPWAGRGASISTTVAGSETSEVKRWQMIAGLLVSTVFLLGLWAVLRPLFKLDEFFVKGPVDAFRFLTLGNPITGASKDDFWEIFFVALGQTGIHSGLGFVVGTLVAVLGAVLFVSVPGMERAAMPFAIILRSMPLIALTPLIVILFGRGLFGVTILVTLVTFFPTLVTVIIGLKAAPEGAIEVIRVSGGSALTAALRVRLMYAVPAITASARIAIPAAVSGAMLAEWIATGNGVGALITQSAVNADYFTLWSSGALVVILVLGLYSTINLVDRAVSRRLGIAL